MIRVTEAEWYILQKHQFVTYIVEDTFQSCFWLSCTPDS